MASSVVGGAAKGSVMSLGTNCQAAYQIRRRFGLKDRYLLDWLIAPPKAVVSLIDTGFDFRLEPATLRLDGDAVRQTEFDLRFVHDFPADPDYLSALPAAVEKYDYLRAKTLSRLSRATPLLIVLHHVTALEALAVASSLERRHPALPYRMLATTPVASDVGREAIAPHIAHVHVKRRPKSDAFNWAGSDASWDHAFTVADSLSLRTPGAVRHKIRSEA